MERTSQNPISDELLEAAALWYRGGHTKKTGTGYIVEYNPYHRNGNRYGYVAQHRLVYERHIGRILDRKEVVHHIDGTKANNDISNLQLFASQAEHLRHHKMHCEVAPCYDKYAIERIRAAAADPSKTLASIDLSPATISKICKMYNIEWKHGLDLTEDKVREALRGRNTKQAAEILGCHPQTLYNNFDHLLNKRKSPEFLSSQIQLVQKIAIEQGMSAACQHFETNRTTIGKALKKAGLWDEYTAESAKRSAHRQRSRHQLERTSSSSSQT
jgi:hypothetical protein